MRDLLLALILTHDDPPEGVDQYNSPIMVVEYVNLMASVKRRSKLKASVENGGEDEGKENAPDF